MATQNNFLAGAGNFRSARYAIVLTMKTNIENQPRRGQSNDFARIEVDAGQVVLEANEWDWAISGHRAVTLYLHPMEARLLAGTLARNADEAEPILIELN